MKKLAAKVLHWLHNWIHHVVHAIEAAIALAVCSGIHTIEIAASGALGATLIAVIVLDLLSKRV